VKYALFILILLSLSCAQKLKQDPFKPSIDTNYKRVETVICGNHSVGENGCVYKNGDLSGSLKIFKVLTGEVTLSGCGLDHSYSYEYDKNNQWLELPLGGKLESDCIIDIYQKIKFPKQETATFPIYGIKGTVSLGTCSSDSSCEFKNKQVMVGIEIDSYAITGDGSYMVTGCGQTVEGPSPIHGVKNLRFDLMWPGGYPSAPAECLFITGVKGVFKQKKYMKINLFSRETQFVSDPDVKKEGSSVSFSGDEYVSLTLTDDSFIEGSAGKFTSNIEGNYLRFYTVNGRSLVAFIRDGEVVWTK
jgi:hypothetical protein